MSYQVLARKWRPQIFKDVVSQEHITTTLMNALSNERVAQAYLLTGTRGVGKTTVARIFAKALRCENPQGVEPCLECSSCRGISDSSSIDYLEIDGASNNSVEDIRSLIENVQYLPTNGKYKIYVIDEVHMLSTSAFNALLKTLEEPPSHVIFIFATTDPEKLIGTVLSRCQRLDFLPVSLNRLKSHIEAIAKSEGISFESDAIVEKIAKKGNGSVRDTLSIFDQVISVASSNNILNSDLNQAVGLADDVLVDSLLSALYLKQRNELLENLDKIAVKGVNPEGLCRQILEELFLVVENPSENLPVDYTELLWIYESLSRDFSWAMESLTPYMSVRFVLLKHIYREEILAGTSASIEVEKKKIIEKPKPKTWDGFLEYTFEKKKSLGVNLERGNVLGSKVFDSAKKVELGFKETDKIFYDFLMEPENKKELLDILNEYCQFDVKLELKLLENKKEEEFKSTVEIREEKLENQQKDAEENFRNNKFLRQAEEVFNSKVNKIVLEKKFKD